ncbi:hypothetical protein ZIOFF_018955 [Zingiber officinale]|uniref:Myb/SANT-like DNA-binding domain-containing protein n=1 Tax=Zingiber officinale TaxID=94328 RepID=A0A8J5HR04_ZINOF|nr:hypothetical protein ZIOFF_018955 [Zingiber officinale]
MSNGAAWSSRMGGERAGGNGGAVGHRPPRLRWWNREILVMLEGKRAVEARDRDPFVAVPAETKWEAVSSYCRQKGVYRSSEQCRRRWGTLMSGYRKIRAWETRDGAAAGNSYWTMGSQERKERRLPGIFEDMLYRILEADEESDGRVGDVGERMQEDEEEDNEDVAEASFSSNQDATESGSFSYADQVNVMKDLPSPIAATPISNCSFTVPVLLAVRKFEPSPQEFADPGTNDMVEFWISGITKDEQPTNDSENKSPQQGRKRHRTSQDEVINNNSYRKLIEVLERNNTVIMAQLEAQKLNIQVDRDQRREQADRLLTILDKVADVLGKFADKL